MSSAACTWSSVASGSSQNARAARVRWSRVICFHRREGSGSFRSSCKSSLFPFHHRQGRLVDPQAGRADGVGWIDAVRLAWLDDSQFEARLKVLVASGGGTRTRPRYSMPMGHLRPGMMRVFLSGLLALALVGRLAAQPRPGVHPISGRGSRRSWAIRARTGSTAGSATEEAPDVALNVLKIASGCDGRRHRRRFGLHDDAGWRSGSGRPARSTRTTSSRRCSRSARRSG